MENIFLALFAFGALFTLASVVLGFVGHGAVHLGHGHADVGHFHVHGTHGLHAETGQADSLPLLNASSVIGAVGKPSIGATRGSNSAGRPMKNSRPSGRANSVCQKSPIVVPVMRRTTSPTR